MCLLSSPSSYILSWTTFLVGLNSECCREEGWFVCTVIQKENVKKTKMGKLASSLSLIYTLFYLRRQNEKKRRHFPSRIPSEKRIRDFSLTKRFDGKNWVNSCVSQERILQKKGKLRNSQWTFTIAITWPSATSSKSSLSATLLSWVGSSIESWELLDKLSMALVALVEFMVEEMKQENVFLRVCNKIISIWTNFEFYKFLQIYKYVVYDANKREAWWCVWLLTARNLFFSVVLLPPLRYQTTRSYGRVFGALL